jgi:hypothetical protein
MESSQISELKALIELQDPGADRETVVRGLWRAVMAKAETSRSRGETRWRDYQKFRADVHILMIHGIL